MIFYISIFILTWLLYNKTIKSKGAFRNCFLGLTVMIPSLIASFRDTVIGRDVELYVVPIWQNSVMSKSFVDLISNDVYGTEFIYLLLNYIVSRFSDSINVFLFFHQVVMMALIVATAYKLRDKTKSGFVIMFYLLYLYNESLSMMRQGLAICFSVFASVYLYENKLKKAYSLIVLSILSHNSAVIMFLLHPLKMFSNHLRRKLFLLISIIISFAFIIYKFYQTILLYTMSIGVASVKYSMYLDQDGFTTHKIDLLFLASIILMLFLFILKNNRDEVVFNQVIIFTVVALALTSLGGITEIANRIAYYFIAPLFFLLPMVSKSKADNNRIIVFTLSILLIRFVYLGITTGIADTIPYHSKILGI